MRARNLKPGFFKNEELAELQPLTRILFEGLWCMADRAGRLEDRVKRIKAEVLPYDNCNVDKMLTELHESVFILRYGVNGMKYIQVLNFSKHQNPHIKEAASTIQAPDENSISTMQAPDEHGSSPADSLSLDSLNLIPDSLNPQSSASTVPKRSTILFDQAYDLYPKKKAREDALKAWKQVNGDIHFDKIRDAIYKQARSPDWLKEDKKYVPLFASWLRGKRWEDETDEKHEGNSEPLGVDGKPLGYWERGLKYWSDDDGGTIPTVPGDDI